MFETGSRDYLACGRILGYGQGDSDSFEESQPSIPTELEARCGEILTETKGGGFGAVNDFKSEVSATEAAVQRCRMTAIVSKSKNLEFKLHIAINVLPMLGGRQE